MRAGLLLRFEAAACPCADALSLLPAQRHALAACCLNACLTAHTPSTALRSTPLQSSQHSLLSVRSFQCSHRDTPALHFSPAAEAAKKAKAEGGEAATADGASKDGKEASRDPSRSPAPASKEDRAKEEGKEGRDKEGKEKERPATRRVLSNEQLCLAFRYLDKTGAGYIRCALSLASSLIALGRALCPCVLRCCSSSGVAC